MSYFDEIEAWLSTVLLPTDEEDEEEWLSRVKKEIKECSTKSGGLRLPECLQHPSSD
jgi:hypothetical protein